jgi:hypothetical protein
MMSTSPIGVFRLSGALTIRTQTRPQLVGIFSAEKCAPIVLVVFEREMVVRSLGQLYVVTKTGSFSPWTLERRSRSSHVIS